MTQSAKEIIKKIAGIQMDALKFIIENPEKLDHVELRKLMQIDNDEFVSAAEDIYQFYQEVEQIPSLIEMASEYQIMVCSHILFQMEDSWIVDNTEGVREAWSIIHRVMDKYHSEFKLLKWNRKE